MIAVISGTKSLLHNGNVGGRVVNQSQAIFHTFSLLYFSFILPKGMLVKNIMSVKSPSHHKWEKSRINYPPKTLVYPGHKLESHIEVDTKNDPSAPSEKNGLFS